MYNFLGAGLMSYLFSAGIKRGFYQFYVDKMRHEFYYNGKRPKYKSPFLTLFLTGIFGGYGMLYASPRFGVPFAIADMFLLPTFIFAIIIRPVEVALSILAVASHNDACTSLKYEFDLHENSQSTNRHSFVYKQSPRINGKAYKRNPYIS